MEWRFREMARGEPNVDPEQAAFFALNSIDTVADALVRESIQNSLDASTDGAVRVRFAREDVPLTEELHNRYLTERLPHLKATNNLNLRIPETPQTLPVLLVEDFGTRELRGDSVRRDLASTGWKPVPRRR